MKLHSNIKMIDDENTLDNFITGATNQLEPVKIYGHNIGNMTLNFESEKESFKVGDIVMVNLANQFGCQEIGIRPAVIISNNKANANSTNVQIIPATSKGNGSGHNTLAEHCRISKDELECLTKHTTFLANAITTINKCQILKKIGAMSKSQLIRLSWSMVFALPIVTLAVDSGIENHKWFKERKNYQKNPHLN